MKIGVAISTRMRPKVLELCISQFEKYKTKDMELVVVDDCSDLPNAVPLYDIVPKDYQLQRNPERLGIAKTKNQCLFLLGDCDYYFLFDDDVFPIKKGWEKLFIDAAKRTGEGHLQFLMDGKLKGHLIKQHEEDGLGIYNTGSGAMLFMTKATLKNVGGLNENYGFYGREHIGYSARIHNMGNTFKGMFLCPLKAEDYLYSLDLNGMGEFKDKLTDFESSMPESERIHHFENEESKKAFEQDCKKSFYQPI